MFYCAQQQYDVPAGTFTVLKSSTTYQQAPELRQLTGVCPFRCYTVTLSISAAGCVACSNRLMQCIRSAMLEQRTYIPLPLCSLILQLLRPAAFKQQSVLPLNGKKIVKFWYAAAVVDIATCFAWMCVRVPRSTSVPLISNKDSRSCTVQKVVTLI